MNKNKATKIKGPPARFVQITGVGQRLAALDEHGNVWYYYPAIAKKHMAFWGRITAHRADKDK